MVKIFVSKKEDDAARAEKLRDVLAVPLGEAGQIVMSQDIPDGTPWRQWIREQLRDTDVLVFLFADPSRAWEWCLFEIGLFIKLEQEEQKPIVCIHPANQQPPDPIGDLQAVPADQGNLVSFLRSLFDGTLTEAPLNRTLAKDDKKLANIADDLLEAWNDDFGLEDRVYYARYLSLIFERQALADEALPDVIEVIGDQASLEIFKLVPRADGKTRVWTDFEDYLRKAVEEAGEDPDRAVAELVEAIEAACREEVVPPATFKLRCLTTKKLYRPVIYRRDFYRDDSVKVRVLMVQLPEELDKLPGACPEPGE